MREPEIAVTELSEFRERRGEVAGGPAAVQPGVPEDTQVPLPVGTVTFLLTDIEGSTRAWEAHGPEMAAAVARHYEILDAAVTGHGGVRPIEQGEGDSLVAAFARASDAVAAALSAQRALLEEVWRRALPSPYGWPCTQGRPRSGTSATTPVPASSAVPECGASVTADKF